ncbi:MAG: MBL fold metallo-hydrolase [Candidatus Velthaea sp.]
MNFGITILGSGGPFATRTRASAGYVVWFDAQPQLLLDGGGGALERIGKAGIDTARIGTIAVTHTHIDHTGGIAPVVFSAYMNERTAPLTFIGPAGREQHPGITRFCDLLFGREGAWSYLHTFEGFGYTCREQASTPGAGGASQVAQPGEIPGIRIRTVPVAHGMMPSIAYRVDYAGRSVVYTGDISGESDELVDLAADCDVLIHDAALPEREVPHGNLHAKPSAIGRAAARAGARHLVLSHIMPELEDEIADALALVRRAYGGKITVAHDLLAIDLNPAIPRPEV